MINIKTFEEWLGQLNETRYHFSYNNNRYTIHQAKTNPSKFGVKNKDGEWEVYVRNDIFDPSRFDMEDKEFLDWIQRGIKHFNILGEVTRKEVFESEWKDLFKYELKHNEPINKRYVILKLQCGKRNAKWNITEKGSEKKEKSVDESSSYQSLDDLKKKYPEAIITMNPSDKFPGRFFARVDIKTQEGEKIYIGALKGPVSEQDALSFFDNILSRNYDKYY